MPPKNAPVNKKHVAHLAKVRRQSAIIKYITIGIFAVVVVLLLGALIYTAGFPPYQNVARVNGESLSANEFRIIVKLQRNSLIRQYQQTLTFAQMFGLDPNTDPNVTGQINQILDQLDPNNKVSLGQQVVDKMIEDALVRQEAKKRGITVSDEELEKYIREDQFNFYPNGTPTPQPTSTVLSYPTINPTQQALVTITPTSSPFPTFTSAPTEQPTLTETPTAGLTPTNGPSPTPEPTSTPYTLEGYQQAYKDSVSRLNTETGMDESFFRQYFFVMPILRQKVNDALTAEVKPFEEQVWARHILVATEDEANQVYAKLIAGEDFGNLAKEISTDTGSGANGGDLGWFGRGAMVAEFEDAAFSQQIGEIGKPVKSQFGYHIIQVLGHEDRPLTDEQINQAKQNAVTEWLAKVKEESNITTYDFWKNIVPTEPALNGQ
jgi:peptidyl-prolyl cis-trans isomerase D